MMKHALRISVSAAALALASAAWANCGIEAGSVRILVLAELGVDAFNGQGWEAFDRGERTPPRPVAAEA